MPLSVASGGMSSMCVGRSSALAVALALAAGCSRPVPIPVGLVSGLSGRHYDLGISTRNGAMLAVEDVNRAGGIGGRPIELAIRDDRQDPETARRAVEELVQLGVVAILGHATSSMVEATLPIVNRERVLMLSPSVTSTSFRGKDDWLVMVSPSDAQAAERLAEYAARKGLARRVAAIYDRSNLAHSSSFHDAFRAAFEARGGQVTVSIPFTSGEVRSFQALAAEAIAGGPDGMLVIANALDSAMICQQVRKLDTRVAILGSKWGFTTDAISHGGASLEGAVTVQQADLGDEVTPALVRFKSAYSERFGRPADYAALQGYDAVLALAEALRRDATRAGVRRSLLAIGTFHGVQGDYQIDRFGDPTRRLFVMTVVGGAMRAVE